MVSSERIGQPIRLGLFSRTLPEWEPQRIAEAAAGAGFAAVEWEVRKGAGHIRAEAAAEDGLARRRDAERAGLDITSVSAFETLSLLENESVSTVVAAAVAAGSGLARMFPPPFDPTRSVEEQLEAVRAVLMRHARGFDEHGVTLMLEMSYDVFVHSPELLRQVCEGIDPAAVGAVYDPANLFRRTDLQQPALGLEFLGPYLHHVHMKNGVFVRSEDRWTSECVRADEGLVDWRTLFAELQQRNYGGWIVIDRLSGEPLEERLEEDRATAEALWNDALSRPGGETIGSAAT